jgi:hypothetical protein
MGTLLLTHEQGAYFTSKKRPMSEPDTTIMLADADLQVIVTYHLPVCSSRPE